MSNAIIIISTLLIGLSLGALLFLIITRQLQGFMDGANTRRTISLLQKDLEMKEKSLGEMQTQTKVMLAELTELRLQNALLKATMAARDTTIDSLKKDCERAAKDIEMMKEYRTSFEKNLFRVLTLHSNLGPTEIKDHFGNLPMNPDTDSIL